MKSKTNLKEGSREKNNKPNSNIQPEENVVTFLNLEKSKVSKCRLDSTNTTKGIPLKLTDDGEKDMLSQVAVNLVRDIIRV
jgi:hypothetical protein